MLDKDSRGITSNQFPERQNYLSRFYRKIASLLPLMGIIPIPSRPPGISIIMRVKNEVDWIKPSIQSIRGIADEIVIVDNGSTDGSIDILTDLSSREMGFIKFWQQPNLDLCSLSNFAIEQTRFRWILRWDGDMIAQTTGNHPISNLRDRLLSLNKDRYYLIYLRHINLKGDLFHQDPKELVHIEEYIHTDSKKARFIHPGRFEAIEFPRYYKPLFWYEPYSFHVDIKPARRMLLRYFWEDWMELKDTANFPTLEAYVNSQIASVFGTNSWQEAEKMCVQQVCKNYIPYDPSIFGPYPDLLIPYLDRSRYRLIFEKGKLVGRQED